MKLRTCLSTFAALVLSATAAWAQETRVIVIFHDTPDETVVTDLGGSVIVRSDKSRMVAARIAANKVAEIAADENVASVSEDCEAQIPGDKQAKPANPGN